jgi:Zn ribbon nucleic-acid-binding protein
MLSGFVAAALWMIAFVIIGNLVRTFDCPRCGKTFAGKWWYNKGILADKCVHCGLLKYAVDSEV